MLAISPVNAGVRKAPVSSTKILKPDVVHRSYGSDEFVYTENPRVLKNTTTVPLNFRGAPRKINFGLVGIPLSGALLAKDAIKVYEHFKLGNYLDIGEDLYHYEDASLIRSHNLSFLDRVEAPEEKKKFIDYYCELTGFPNLYEVSENIKIQFVKAVQEASEVLNSEMVRTGRSGDCYNVVQAGYDGICSVGRHKALPGSDLDKAYVIIKGDGNAGAKDLNYVKNFKWKLWDYTDQRILSYNHDAAAFPQVYTEGQFNALLESADNMCLDELQIRRTLYNKEDYLSHTYMCMVLPIHRKDRRTKFMMYREKLNKYDEDYVQANSFYIDLCKKFPAYSGNDFKNPNRTMIKNIGFVIEAMRDGVYFTKFGKMNYWILQDSITFNLVNLSQLRALKNHNDRKPKRLARMSLQEEFPKWDIDKQYRFIKTLIESSCANNREFTEEFAEYFSRGGKDLFEPLIEALLQ